MLNLRFATAVALALLCLNIVSMQAAMADITLIHGQPRGTPADRVDITLGGSIRPQYVNRMGSVDDGSYRHAVYDGGTRFRLTGRYLLSPDTVITAYYEPGVDMAHLLGMHGHYDPRKRRIVTRQRYVGLSNARWGTLTVGKQYSVYYDVVGVKTDVWDHDKLGQGPTNGVNGSYDGSYRGRRLVNYHNRLGPVEFYAGWILPQHGLHLPRHIDYDRHNGAAVGFNYHVTDDLVVGLAYSTTRATLSRHRDEKDVAQQLVGSAFSWTPGAWSISAGGGYYRNFVPDRSARLSRYLARDAFGGEFFIARTFAAHAGILDSVKPYAAGDRLQRTSGQRYQGTHEYLGLVFNLAGGFRTDFEHTFTQTSDDKPDENWIRLRYDF